MKKILLSFDVEEFDLPEEFGIKIDKEKEFEISKKGLLLILDLLNKHSIKATFFITAVFAEKYPKIIKKMSKKYEIACHGYKHSDNYILNIEKIGSAKKQIEKIIGKKIKGFRAPRFEIRNINELEKFVFNYDSSIHPTISLGKPEISIWKSFNIFKKRKIHKIGNIVEIPLSTLPLFPFLRAPINWFMFRHFPKIYRKTFAKINFIFSDYLTLLFHPWEFVNIESLDIPKSFKKNSGEKTLKMLEEYIQWCKKNNYEFATFEEFLNQKNNVPAH